MKKQELRKALHICGWGQPGVLLKDRRKIRRRGKMQFGTQISQGNVAIGQHFLGFLDAQI